MYKCDKCDRLFKTYQGLNSHIGWHKKPNRESNFIKYNEGVKNGEIEKVNTNHYTKSENEGTPYPVMSIDTRMKISKSGKNQIWDDERRKKHSIAMKKAVMNNPLSYSANNVCGRTKLIEYRGFKLNGRWELLVAEFLDSKQIKWTNKIDGINYQWKGKEHLYFPDFYLEDMNMYIEVKGFERERDRAKWKSMDNLIIIKLKEINKIKKGTYNL